MNYKTLKIFFLLNFLLINCSDNSKSNKQNINIDKEAIYPNIKETQKIEIENAKVILNIMGIIIDSNKSKDDIIFSIIDKSKTILQLKDLSKINEFKNNLAKLLEKKGFKKNETLIDLLENLKIENNKKNIKHIDFNIEKHKIGGNIPNARTLTYFPKSKDGKPIKSMEEFCKLLYEETYHNGAKEWIKWIRSIQPLTQKYGMYYGFGLEISGSNEIKITLKADKTLDLKNDSDKPKNWSTIDRFSPELEKENIFKGGGKLDQYKNAKLAADKANKLINLKQAIAFNNSGNTVRLCIPWAPYPTIIQFSKEGQTSEIEAIGKIIARQTKALGFDNVEKIRVNCVVMQTVAQLHFRIFPKKLPMDFKYDIWLGEKTKS